MQSFYKKLLARGFPLRATLLTAAVLAILLTMAAISLPAYYSFQKSTGFLWKELGDNIAKRTSEYITEEFHKAPDALQTITQLFEMQDLNIFDSFQIIDVCYNGLKSNPNFAWFYFAQMDGTIYATFRDRKTEQITGAWGIPNQRSPSGERLTHMYDYSLNAEGKWEETEIVWNDYDPRNRPWWQEAIAHPSGTWSEPYRSFDAQWGVVFTYTQAQVRNGRILGLWAVDYEIDQLSEFLNQITKTLEARILVILENGTIIADSDLTSGLILKSVQGEDAKDRILQGISEELKKNPQMEGSILSKDYFTYVESLSPSPNMKWKVLTIINKSHFFGPVYHAVLLGIIFAIPLSILFIILAAAFFGGISQQLKEITAEMDEVKSLRISTKKFPTKPSFVREVNIMRKALDHMKIALGSFAKYVPKDLILELIKSGQSAVLGGRKAQMTLLFADLANFTRLSEELATDEVMVILGDYLKEMSNVIQKHQGIVDKYIGDAIFAFWGAPDRIKDHALAACQTALDMQERFQYLWPNLPSTYKILLRQRIGINTGRVFVGNVGSAERFDYTAIGNAVNLASRIEGLNRLYKTTILVGEETEQVVRNEMLLRPIDWVAVKGKVHATLIYELIGPREGADEILLEAISLYQMGLEKYRNREFSQAEEKFHMANSLFGGSDIPCKILSERCLAFLTTPPSEEWNGAIVLEEKY